MSQKSWVFPDTEAENIMMSKKELHYTNEPFVGGVYTINPAKIAPVITDFHVLSFFNNLVPKGIVYRVLQANKLNT
jgi:hypothetical protein